MNTAQIEEIKQAEPAEALEHIIDKHGIARVIKIMAEICDEKSNHVAENWQDYSLASEWSKIGQKLDNLQIPIL